MDNSEREVVIVIVDHLLIIWKKKNFRIFFEKNFRKMEFERYASKLFDNSTDVHIIHVKPLKSLKNTLKNTGNPA